MQIRKQNIVQIQISATVISIPFVVNPTFNAMSTASLQ